CWPKWHRYCSAGFCPLASSVISASQESILFPEGPMPENAKPTPPPANAPKTPPASASQGDAGHIPITEELDSAKWTLPPIAPLLVAAVLVGLVVTLIVLSNRSTPSASLAITKM